MQTRNIFRQVLFALLALNALFSQAACLDNDKPTYRDERDLGALKMHSATINDLAYSPNNFYLASAAEDNSVYLSHVLHLPDSGDCKICKRHFIFLHDCYECKDLMLPLSHDRPIRLAHEASVSSLCFTADNRYLVTGSRHVLEGGQINLWDVETGERLSKLYEHRSAVAHLAASKDGRFLVSADSIEPGYSELLLWSLPEEIAEDRPEVITRLTGQRGVISDIAFSNDSTSLVALFKTGAFALWDTETGELIDSIDLDITKTRAIAFSIDDTLIAIGGANLKGKGVVAFYDAENGEHLATEKLANQAITSLAFAGDNCALAAGSEDHYVYVMQTNREMTYDLPTIIFAGIRSFFVEKMHGHERTITALAFMPTGSALASGSADAMIKFWAMPKLAQSRCRDGEDNDDDGWTDLDDPECEEGDDEAGL